MRRLLDLLTTWPAVSMFVAVVLTQALLLTAGAFTLRDNREAVQSLRDDIAGMVTQGDERTQRAVRCLLANQNDHRINHHAGMEHLLRLHGFDPPPPPAPPPLADLPTGQEGCSPFRTATP